MTSHDSIYDQINALRQQAHDAWVAEDDDRQPATLSRLGPGEAVSEAVVEGAGALLPTTVRTSAPVHHRITVSSTVADETVTCDPYDLAASIGPWYPDAPTDVTDAIAELERRLTTERYPYIDGLCVYLAITIEAAQPLDLEGFADRVGVEYSTIRRYRGRGMLPDPDVTLGQSSGWYADTIDAWQESRPGRGRRTKA